MSTVSSNKSKLMSGRLGIRGYLESSKEGRRLYEQCGFEVVQDLEWDTRPWGGDFTDVHYVSSSRFVE